MRRTALPYPQRSWEPLPSSSTISGRSGRGRAVWFSLPLVLWGLLWLSINSGPWNLPEFGAELASSINALRASLPLFVLWIALLSLMASRRRHPLTTTELGFWVYGIVMLLACTGANKWFDQAYWGFAFLAALAVAEMGLRGHDRLEFARNLNCFSWALATAALVAMLFLARDLLVDPNTVSAYGVSTRFEEKHGYVISRSTGLARLAAIPAMVGLVLLFAGNWWIKILSAAIIAASVSVIWIMQARGAFFAFFGALLFILFFGKARLRKLGLMLIGLIAVLSITDNPPDQLVGSLWSHVTRGEGSEGLSTMSGRKDIWSTGIGFWRESPITGYGPQADRLLMGANSTQSNAQNAILYALLSSGVLGTAFFMLSNVAAWLALLSCLRQIDRFNRVDRAMLQITGAIIVFSTLRSIPENHAALFSIDLLLQYPAMIYLAYLARVGGARTRSRVETAKGNTA